MDPRGGSASTTTNSSDGAGTSTPIPNSRDTNTRRRNSWRLALAAAGLKPEVLPGGTGLTCDFGPERAPHRVARRHRRPADGGTHRPRTRRRSRTSRTRAAMTRTPLCCWARPGAGVGSRPPGGRAADLPARRGTHARRRARGVAAGALTGVSRIFAAALRSAARGRAGSRSGRSDHVGGRHDRGDAALAGRTHVASAPDR